MAEKRKYDRSPESDQSRLATDDGKPSTSPQGTPTIVENYPRKRIAIAVGRSNAALTPY